LETMKAIAAMGDGTIQIVEVPRVTHGPYECLVRVTACGLCNGTDLKIIAKGKVAQQDVLYPTLIGHEAIGVIEEVGEKVRNLKKGDRIVCPVCTFEPPGYHSNWGGMNGYGITHDIVAMIEDGVAQNDPIVAQTSPEDYLGKPIPNDMSDPDAVMLLTLKENYSALLNFGVGEGTDLLIYGDGPVGLGLASFAKLLGAKSVVVVGLLEDRLARIQELGHADIVINSTKQNVSEVLGDRKFDVMIDAVGLIEVALEGAQYLKSGGLVGCYGVLEEKYANINLLALPNNTRVQILNWPVGEHRTHDAVVKLVQDGKVDPKWFYSHVMSIDDAQKGLEMIRSREAFKVIFTM